MVQHRAAFKGCYLHTLLFLFVWDKASLCSSAWLCTHSNPPASASCRDNSPEPPYPSLLPLLELAPDFLVTILKCVGQNLAQLRKTTAFLWLCAPSMSSVSSLAGPLSLGGVCLAAPPESGISSHRSSILSQARATACAASGSQNFRTGPSCTDGEGEWRTASLDEGLWNARHCSHSSSHQLPALSKRNQHDAERLNATAEATPPAHPPF